MSAFKEITKIGILAGSGDMPRLLVEACRRQGIDPFVVALGHEVDFKWLSDDIVYKFIAPGKAGMIIDAFKEWSVSDLVMIGAVRKPSIIGLIPDKVAIEFLGAYAPKPLSSNTLLKDWTDDSLLSKLRTFLEGKGFSLHGAHAFLPDILSPEGGIGSVPYDAYQEDIQVGVRNALEWGKKDKGQAVIVRDGEVVAREKRRGTDAMIRKYNRQKGAVLVKMCKPEQDRDLDLPTIGLRTVQMAADSGFAGIAVHAGASFFLDREEAVALADAAGLFIVGVNP